MSDVATTCSCGVCDGCRAAMDAFLCDALCEAAAACDEVGAEVTFYVRGEGEVERDDYRSIKELQRTVGVTHAICAMNVEWQPSKKRLERAGLIDESEVVIWTPTKQWIDLGIDFLAIDIKRTTVQLGAETFTIREKGRANVVVGLVPLFYTFGLQKGR